MEGVCYVVELMIYEIILIKNMPNKVICWGPRYDNLSMIFKIHDLWRVNISGLQIKYRLSPA